MPVWTTFGRAQQRSAVTRGAATILFAGLLWLQSEHRATADDLSGFIPLERSPLKSLQFLQTSVVQVISVGGSGEKDETDTELVDLEKSHPESRQQKLLAGKSPTAPQPNLRAIQIETCRKQQLRFCPVQKGNAMSTGFFQDGNRLWMCRHSFHNWLVWASKANNRDIRTLSPPMVIYNKDRKVIYNSATAPTDDLARFGLINDDPRVNIQRSGQVNLSDKSWYNYIRSDVVAMDWTNHLVPQNSANIELGTSKLAIGTRVFAAGYPGKTNYFSDKSLDSPGGKLVVSSGRIGGVVPREVAIQSNVLTKTGSSGAPLLLEDGTVIGVICYAAAPKALDHPETATATALVPDVWALRAGWQQLRY
ncbi:S1 family peptidase [Aestuariivirga sp.]|uniref:S1 family peptidase n=1 Tax=Aestuariivirga sp. TaxID=2650926 RepID=UPI0039E40B79